MERSSSIIFLFETLAGKGLSCLMSLRFVSIFLLLLSFSPAFSQRDTYFYKIQNAIAKIKLDTEVYKKIDSLERTKRVSGSFIKIMFNRDVDFGYKHKRIQIRFNDFDYQVNLLTKNDSVCLSSTIWANELGIYDDDHRFNKRHSIPSLDSAKSLNYLKLRNQFYKSLKTLRDLKEELDLDDVYALWSGDGYVSYGKLHIDTLVNRRDFKQLESMLRSINCETQAYGVLGFDLLKKKKVKIPVGDAIIITAIKKRNSDLESCAGDICPIIWKAYK